MDFHSPIDTVRDMSPPDERTLELETQGSQPSAAELVSDTAATLVHSGDNPGYDPTLLGEHTSPSSTVAAGPRTTFGRSTILPRFAHTETAAPQIVRNETERYVVSQRLGEGAAGAVDLAIDNDIQREVAIKWLKEGDNPEMVLRFADEVRMVGRLEHPNIVPIHDVGQAADGKYYFVMKRVAGDTLEEVIAKLAAGDVDYHKRYTFEYRARIFLEILKAVEFAHAQGIVHRDLKPANIMVGPYGEVMVMDWGIAKNIKKKGDAPQLPEAAIETDKVKSPSEPGQTQEQLERLYSTQYGSIIGTPLFMSPEQVRGKADEIDQRSDIYSLSAVFYELLALQPYLQPKETIEDTLRAVLTEKPKHPMMIWTKVQSPPPAELGHFILKGLSKDPDDRFQSIAEMRERLQLIDEGYIKVQCPFTATKRVIHGSLHFVTRHPILSLGSLVLLFSGFLTASGFAISELLSRG